MSYSYQYTNKLSQFGMTNYNLKLTDSDKILPEFNVPVIVKDSDLSEELLINIAQNTISQKLQEINNAKE
jgi:hypothetical protein